MTDTLSTLYDLHVKEGDKVFFKVDNSTGTHVIGKPHKVSELNAGARIWSIVSRASDTPTKWADMTPEEKGALLLAKHEGVVIQRLSGGLWVEVNPNWSPLGAYRVNPEPKRETVTMVGYEINGWYFAEKNSQAVDTHRITFDTIDGEPDCASIRMELLT